MNQLIQKHEPSIRLLPLFVIVVVIACCADFALHHGIPAIASIGDLLIAKIGQVLKP